MNINHVEAINSRLYYNLNLHKNMGHSFLEITDFIKKKMFLVIKDKYFGVWCMQPLSVKR